MIRTRCLLLIIFSCGMAGVTGCGGAVAAPKLPDPVPVKGTITLDGQPLASALVYFMPEGAKSGLGANGITNAGGTYELVTASGKVIKPGTIPGNYRVLVSRLIGPDGKPIAPNPDTPPANLGARESLPPRYSDFAMTELKAVVGEQGGSFDFKVKSR